jgi:hypothetical protein
MCYKFENNFRTLTEWLTGRRVSDGRCTVRSDEKCREGLYWVLRFSKPLASLKACRSVVLKYIRSGTLDVREWCGELKNMEPCWACEIYVGITDDPWLRNPDDVSAWYVALQDVLGKIIAKKQSFLWSGDEMERNTVEVRHVERGGQ